MAHVPQGPYIRGRLLTTYGPFHIYERFHQFALNLEPANAEIDYVPAASAEGGEQSPYLFVAYINTCRISDLDTVLRHIRMWLNGRRRGFERGQDLLAYFRENPEEVPPEEHISTLEAEQEQLSREYAVLRRALLDLEAQHPEIDLGPIESTMTNYRPGLLKFVTDTDHPPDEES